MDVTFIISELFDTTRSLASWAARRPGLRVRLAKGDTDAEGALRAVRSADRIWFEGDGPCLRHLATRGAARWLPKATLRIGPDRIDALPVPDVWRLVGEVVLPSRAAAARLREALRPPPHVAVGSGSTLEDLQAALLRPAGDLAPESWPALVRAADVCRRRVFLRGDPPDPVARYLRVGHGLEVVSDGPADAVLDWNPRPASGEPSCRIACAAEGAEEDIPPPPEPDPKAGPAVSIVVPVYNGAGTIDRCLRSLRRQTWPNLEILVVDDGSTDGTAAAVRAHLSDPRVHYLYKPHSGRPETRNLGIEKSTGEWIAWLGADDAAMPNRIAAQMAAARAAGGADIVHSDALYMGPDGSVAFHRRYARLEGPDVPARLMAGLAGFCPVLDTSAAIRRDLYERIGPYDPAFPRCQDYEFYVRAAAAGDVRFCHVPAPLVRVHNGPKSPETRLRILGHYHTLARRLLERFGVERLADPVARDLHEPPSAVVGHHLLAAALVFGAPEDHPMLADAERLLSEALGEARGPCRDDLRSLLAVAADARPAACGRKPDAARAAGARPGAASAAGAGDHDLARGAAGVSVGRRRL